MRPRLAAKPGEVARHRHAEATLEAGGRPHVHAATLAPAGEDAGELEARLLQQQRDDAGAHAAGSENHHSQRLSHAPPSSLPAVHHRAPGAGLMRINSASGGTPRAPLRGLGRGVIMPGDGQVGGQ